eukprot:scaffold6811_cov62-Attheya_sp.AAC.1
MILDGTVPTIAASGTFACLICLVGVMYRILYPNKSRETNVGNGSSSSKSTNNNGKGKKGKKNKGRHGSGTNSSGGQGGVRSSRERIRTENRTKRPHRSLTQKEDPLPPTLIVEPPDTSSSTSSSTEGSILNERSATTDGDVPTKDNMIQSKSEEKLTMTEQQESEPPARTRIVSQSTVDSCLVNDDVSIGSSFSAGAITHVSETSIATNAMRHSEEGNRKKAAAPVVIGSGKKKKGKRRGNNAKLTASTGAEGNIVTTKNQIPPSKGSHTNRTHNGSSNGTAPSKSNYSNATTTHAARPMKGFPSTSSRDRASTSSTGNKGLRERASTDDYRPDTNNSFFSSSQIATTTTTPQRVAKNRTRTAATNRTHTESTQGFTNGSQSQPTSPSPFSKDISSSYVTPSLGHSMLYQQRPDMAYNSINNRDPNNSFVGGLNITNTSSDGMLRYRVPSYASYSHTDNRYTPGKLELAALLGQVGLFGAACADLLADLSDVDALGQLKEIDYERYNISKDKQAAIVFLLDVRRHRQEEEKELQLRAAAAAGASLQWSQPQLLRPPPGLGFNAPVAEESQSVASSGFVDSSSITDSLYSAPTPTLGYEDILLEPLQQQQPAPLQSPDFGLDGTRWADGGQYFGLLDLAKGKMI